MTMAAHLDLVNENLKNHRNDFHTSPQLQPLHAEHSGKNRRVHEIFWGQQLMHPVFDHCNHIHKHRITSSHTQAGSICTFHIERMSCISYTWKTATTAMTNGSQIVEWNVCISPNLYRRDWRDRAVAGTRGRDARQVREAGFSLRWRQGSVVLTQAVNGVHGIQWTGKAH